MWKNAFCYQRLNFFTTPSEQQLAFVSTTSNRPIGSHCRQKSLKIWQMPQTPSWLCDHTAGICSRGNILLDPFAICRLNNQFWNNFFWSSHILSTPRLTVFQQYNALLPHTQGKNLIWLFSFLTTNTNHCIGLYLKKIFFHIVCVKICEKSKISKAVQ